jgi:hypothetical protein
MELLHRIGRKYFSSTCFGVLNRIQKNGTMFARTPVRAVLVAGAEEWPYVGEIFALEYRWEK